MRVLVSFAVLFVGVAHAQELEPAYAFGSGGVVTIAIGEDSVAHGVDFDDAGRVVVSGVSWESGTSHAVVGRLLVDGSPDTSFASDGWFHQRSVESSGAYAVDASTEIYAAGYEFRDGRTEMMLLSLDNGGTPSSLFGSDGVARFDVGGRDDAAVAIAVHGERLLVAGYAVRAREDGLSAEDFAVLAVERDGNLDPSFGTAGVTIVSIGNDLDTPHDLVVEGARIVVVGRSSHDFGMREGFSAARLHLDSGLLDESFGDSGALSIEFDGYPVSRARAVYASGSESLLLAGFRDVGEREEDLDLAAMALDARGTLSTSFGVNGQWSASPLDQSDERIESLVSLRDQIFAIGQAGGQLFVSPIETEGSPDIDLTRLDVCAGSPMAVHDAAVRDDVIVVAGACSRGLFAGEMFVAAYRYIAADDGDAAPNVDAGSDSSLADIGVPSLDAGADSGSDPRRRDAGCSCRAGVAPSDWVSVALFLLLLARRRHA